MRITRLHLRDFRCHADLEVLPAPGLTVITGANEAGKSSLQEAIELALFRKAESASQATLEVARWGADGVPGVTLEFVDDGVEGRLVKSWAGGRGSVELTLGEEVIGDPAEVQRRIEGITGLPGERFFRATASVRHYELEAIGSGDRQLSDRLQVVVSGADRGTAQAKKMLEEAIARYRREGAKNPGLVKVERERLAALEQRLDEGEAALTRLETERAAWVAARERRVELDARVERAEAELAEAERAADLVSRRDSARERYERLRRAADLALDRAAILATPPPPLPLPELRTRVAQVQRMGYEYGELEAELAVEPDDEVDEEPPVKPRAWPLVAAAIVVGLAAIGVFVVLGDPLRLLVPAVLLVLGAVLLVLASGRVREARRMDLEARLSSTAREARRLNQAERQEAYRRVRRDLEGQLADLGLASADEAGPLLAGAEAREADLGRVEAELRGLLGSSEPPADLETERDRAANEAERADHALKDMEDLVVDAPAVLRHAKALVTSLRAERDGARSEEDQALGRLGSDPTDAEAVAAAAEELEGARERLKGLERRLRIYQGTLEAIRSAETSTMKAAARFLEERMGPDLARITDGRYRRVKVDENDLAFSVWAPEVGDYVPVSQLSRGTADQLYLVARLGLVRLVTMDRRPPLILDDPFVTFDPARARRALEVVKRLAAEGGFQVLHLTASEEHLDLADAVVRLPSPAGRDDEAAIGRDHEAAMGGDDEAAMGPSAAAVSSATPPSPEDPEDGA